MVARRFEQREEMLLMRVYAGVLENADEVECLFLFAAYVQRFS